MTNEEKSAIIAHNVRNRALGKYESAYQGAMEMAKFKDEEFKKRIFGFLNAWISTPKNTPCYDEDINISKMIDEMGNDVDKYKEKIRQQELKINFLERVITANNITMSRIMRSRV